MNKKNILVARILTYSGILPFLIFGLAVTLHLGEFNSRLAFFSYGAVILSFICGIHWATCLFFPSRHSANLLLQTNLITLLGWLSLLLGQHKLSLGLQCFCFIYLLAIDCHLYRQGVFPQWFFNIRISVSTLVISLLIMGGLFL
jgi:hypothetical protein